jgi:hypothetical protein
MPHSEQGVHGYPADRKTGRPCAQARLGPSREPPRPGSDQICDRATAHTVILGTNKYKPHHPTKYKPHHPTPPNVDQHHPTPPHATRLHHQGHAALHQQMHCNPQGHMPSPGGQISGMASYENCCEGYYTATRGKAWITHVPVSSRVAPGLPCGRAVPDRRDATRIPACEIVGDPAVTVRSLTEADRFRSY